MAAIPDSNGQVNACYKSSTQALRVTDPAGSCATNETALSWSQTGPPGPAGTDGLVAYAHVSTDASGNTVIDSQYSQHIINAYSGSGGYLCLEFDPTVVNPHSIVSVPDFPNSAGASYLANVAPGSSYVTNNCNAGAGAMVELDGTGASGFIIVY